MLDMFIVEQVKSRVRMCGGHTTWMTSKEIYRATHRLVGVGTHASIACTSYAVGGNRAGLADTAL
jgi:hypothetical protein